eukprot:80403-Prymnesium_polylepis.4
MQACDLPCKNSYTERKARKTEQSLLVGGTSGLTASIHGRYRPDMDGLRTLPVRRKVGAPSGQAD